VQQLFLITDEDKEEFMRLTTWLQDTYFADVLSFAVLDNHYHLIVNITPPPEKVDLVDMQQRYLNYYPNRPLDTMDVQKMLKRWTDLSKFMADLNRYFAIYMNRKNHTSGHFWSDRFYSTILEDDEALLNCMTYVDLNAIRAGIVNMPDQYNYGTVGYLLKKKNRSGMIALERLQNILSQHITEKNAEVQAMIARLKNLPNQFRISYARYIVYLRELVRQEKKEWRENRENVGEKQESKINFFQHLRYFSRAIAVGSHKFLNQIYAKASIKKKLRFFSTDIPSLAFL
jgi:REP element-mobilizing transposase RayT